MRHEIKIGLDFANAVLAKEKTFEIRRNDRGYQKGDAVVFRVVDRDGNELPEHPLNAEVYEITYVLSGWGLRDGFVAFGIKETLPY
jgi:hypothetical protein